MEPAANVINLDAYWRRRSAPDPIPTVDEEPVGPASAPTLPLKESRRGNLNVNTERFNCVVYPLGPRAWGYRLTDQKTGQGAYGRGRHPDQISAQLAAEEDLRHFEEDPRAWGVRPAPQV
jgi:hypothetical protein